MKYHCFIFNWSGQEEKTIEIYNSIASHGIKTTVINSDDSLIEKYKWIHIGEQAYFSEQFNKAMELFDDDDEILFQITGDSQYENWFELIKDSLWHFNKYKWGIYAPNVDWTAHSCVDINKIEEHLTEVSNTDSICWFIHKDIIKNMPKIDIEHNKLGWGIDIIMCYLSNIQKRKVMRNYKHTIKHPKFTNYDKNIASNECAKFVNNFIENYTKFKT